MLCCPLHRTEAGDNCVKKKAGDNVAVLPHKQRRSMLNTIVLWFIHQQNASKSLVLFTNCSNGEVAMAPFHLNEAPPAHMNMQGTRINSYAIIQSKF